jgi:C1A family cysteine protease
MIKAITAVVVALSGLASAEPVDTFDNEIQLQKDFSAWIQKFDKQYDTMELFYRFGVYKQNRAKIDAHNHGDHSYQLGENQFMDLTGDEFERNYLSGIVKKGTTYRNSLLGAEAACTQANFGKAKSSSIDWTAKGMVTQVKNQGQCGSCWAFSTTGSVESHVAIKSGKPPVSLSEQELVDCSSSYGNQGCNGGLMDYGFEYIMANGICAESAYPYTASQGTCKQCTKVAEITGCQDIPQGDPDQLKGALESSGPVSIAVEADQLAFQFYHGGVLTGNCGTKLDHGVLLVGFSDTDEQPFWKVKNSWGATWGEQGYLRIAQAQDKCGVELSASIPIV